MAPSKSFTSNIPVHQSSPTKKAALGSPSPKKVFSARLEPSPVKHFHIVPAKQSPLSPPVGEKRQSSPAIAKSIPSPPPPPVQNEAKSVSKITFQPVAVSSVPAKPVVIESSCISVKSRIQTFQNQLVADAKPKVANPEKLPVRAKASLFEAAIKEEALSAAKVNKRDEFLRQKKLGNREVNFRMETSKVTEEVEPLDRSKETRQFHHENTQWKADAKLEAFEEEPMEVQEELQVKSVDIGSDLPSSLSTEPLKRAVVTEEANESCEQNDDVSLSIATKRQETAVEEAYYAKPSTVDSDAHHSLTTSTESTGSSQSSAESAKLYPDLSQVDECEVYQSSPSKQARYEARQSLHANISPVKKYAEIVKEKVDTPLRTLSQYRLQQKVRAQDEAQTKIVYGVHDDEEDRQAEVLEEQKRKELLRRKIQELKTEAKVQEESIFQATKAINLCLTAAEGSNSHVDAERTLLVASEYLIYPKSNYVIPNSICTLANKRVAVLNHIHYLNSLMKQPTVKHVTNGSVRITQIDLPISQDMILSYAKGQGVHSNRALYLFCLIVCEDHVAGTEALCIKDAFGSGTLSFKLSTAFVAQNLQNDFQIRIEVYGLSLPKANAKKDHKGTLKLTPRKTKKVVSQSLSAPSQSSEVTSRMPRAKIFGSIVLNLNNCRKRNILLHNFVTGCPLIGTIDVVLELRASYDMQAKNFMNFYEERDGGVWVRRWCVLDGYKFSYWRYQEDAEAKKAPLGSIDLRNCINPEIVAVSQETCARKFTFMLLTANSKDTFVRVQYLLHKNYNTMISTRYLIAADVRSERDEWLDSLNKIIKNVRLWEANAMQPCSKLEVEKYLK
ncbi:Anillin [Halotydeus destructor]|nr:Anillin [Halotydeus destructor]